MSAKSEFYLNRSSGVKGFDTLELSHPNFSKTYWIVRNARYGITATLDDGVTQQFFQYYPLQIKGIASDQNLDQILEVQLGDLGTILPVELDNIALANGFQTKPVCIFRQYRSDDLTQPVIGPIQLEITNLSFTHEGSSFQATAPSLNNNNTGEIYTFERFPPLRGFI